MEYGTELEFDIDRLDPKGRGCGTLHDEARFGESGRPACAHGTIPGERVRGAFIGKKKGVFRVEASEILSKSSDRNEPECPHASLCGGCSLQHIDYERQLSLKLEGINRTLRFRKLDLEVREITGAENRFHYRNRMDFAFGPEGQLGLKAAGRWNRYIDLTTCLLLSEDADTLRKHVAEWARSSEVAFWNPKTHEGYFRYLVIREGKRTGERLAMLVTSEGELPDAEGFMKAVEGLTTSVYHGINPTITDLSIAQKLRLLSGEELLHEEVGGIRYAIHPNAFFQTNTAMAEKLQEHVRTLVKSKPHERLLDLYCGSGFFALSLANDVTDVLGIELDTASIEMARENARKNGLMNTRFRAEAAEVLSWKVERPDVVILDPPRAGLHPKVIATLLAHLPPRIIYVSCNPLALARDLEALTQEYRAEEPRAFDLFPQTMHIETVIHLIKK